MTTIIDMTEDEFDAAYELLPNHLNLQASWASGEGAGCLFETYGEELQFVRLQDPQTIWTVLDGEDGNLCVVSGYHFVNRIGYLISTTIVPEGHCIQVTIPTSSDGE